LIDGTECKTEIRFSTRINYRCVGKVDYLLSNPPFGWQRPTFPDITIPPAEDTVDVRLGHEENHFAGIVGDRSVVVVYVGCVWIERISDYSPFSGASSVPRKAGIKKNGQVFLRTRTQAVVGCAGNDLN